MILTHFNKPVKATHRAPRRAWVYKPSNQSQRISLGNGCFRRVPILAD